MEMLFKLPEGKPPFIGVVFDTVEEAMLNKDLLEMKTSKFSIMKESYDLHKLSFRLISDNPINIRLYNNIKMDLKAFKAWRGCSHRQLNFGHVVMVSNKPEVVRIDKKLFVLKIDMFITG